MLPRRFCTLVGLAAFTLLLGAVFVTRNYGFYETSLGAPRPNAPPEEHQAPPPAKSSPTKAESEQQQSARPTFLLGSLVGTASPLPKPSAPSKPPSTPQETGHVEINLEDVDALRISIVESGGSHEEVVASLTHTFGSLPKAQLSLYLLLKRFGLTELIETFALSSKSTPPMKSSYDFPKLYTNDTIPHILVSTTCELDILRLNDAIDAILNHGRTYLFCVVHHADKWGEEEKLQVELWEWIERRRVTFLTLSPHTAEYFRTVAIQNWPLKDEVIVDYLVPVYPVPRDRPLDDLISEDELAFAMQGDYDSRRRDYQAVFSQLEKFLGSEELSDENKKLNLHLLGHGSEPLVPASVKDHVFFDSSLDYLDYYALLSRSFALLPAFATDEYLDRKASSSIPAALIGGTPLVVTQAILDAYSYLTNDVVWFQREGETDMDVVGRVLRMPAEQRERRKDLVQQRLAALVEDNILKTKRWVKEALGSIGP